MSYNIVKKKGEDLKKKKKVNGPGKSKLGQGRNSWKQSKHAWLYSDLLQALKREHMSALGSQQMGILISASAVPLCRTDLQRPEG